jgi:phage tail protein X
MTRETKISLLVGLAFIIVIGILLSDHFHATQELPQAFITDVGNAVRRSTNEPGTDNPPTSFVAPDESSPAGSVPTHEELDQPPSPVVPSHSASGNGPAPMREDHGADAPKIDPALNNAAQQNGESLVQANPDGSTQQQDNGPAGQAPTQQSPAPVSEPKKYRAQDGDTVSRMAAHFLGSNTRENRQAIIDANPSLKDDPDRVIVGKMYVIPAAGGSNSSPSAGSDSNGSDSSPQDAQANPPQTANGEYFYTVQEGDSLWRIANDQLGDPSAVQALKDLNQSVLKGDSGDVVEPGMKLRLPSKPVASTGTN